MNVFLERRTLLITGLWVVMQLFAQRPETIAGSLGIVLFPWAVVGGLRYAARQLRNSGGTPQ